jgi:nicotinamide-nucleotide amidase
VVGDLLKEKRKTLTTVESCTGGLLAKTLTDIPGCSAYFWQGWVTYTNQAKMKEVLVPADLLEKHGAVSEPVARAMASRGREIAKSHYALSVTGIAGPTGGTKEKPVGLVFIGLAYENECRVFKLLLGSHLSREQIRIRTVGHCLNNLRLSLLGE